MKARWDREEVVRLTEPCPGSGKAPLGLRPPEPHPHSKVGLPRGVCPVCHENRALRADGTMRLHRPYGERVYIKEV